MGSAHGSKARTFLDGYDLSPFLRNVEMPGEADTAEATTFTDPAGVQRTDKVYLPGLAGGTVSCEGILDGDDVTGCDLILATALGNPSSAKHVFSYLPQGDGFGNPHKGLSMDETSYEIATPVDDVGVLSIEGQGSVRPEAGKVLATWAARTATGNGTGHDSGVGPPAPPTVLGGAAYLHVTAVSGTTPNLVAKVQHSNDNGGGDAWADLVTFTAKTAIGGERIAIPTTTSIKRYTRAIWTITGTTPSFTFLVAVHRR